MTDVTLWGTLMTPIIIGLVILFQQLGLTDYWADWVRALLFAVVTFVGAYQVNIAAAVPWLPDLFSNLMLALTVLLTLKAAWPDLRSMWNRAAGGPGAENLSDFAARSGAKYANGRGRLW